MPIQFERLGSAKSIGLPSTRQSRALHKDPCESNFLKVDRAPQWSERVVAVRPPDTRLGHELKGQHLKCLPRAGKFPSGSALANSPPCVLEKGSSVVLGAPGSESLMVNSGTILGFPAMFLPTSGRQSASRFDTMTALELDL